MRALLLVFNLFWTCSFSATQAGIVYPPVSTNVSVGQTALFSCTAVADVIEWLADNEPVSDYKVHVKGFNAHTEPLNSMIGLRQSNLSVAGREENDNVSITCIAFNNSDLIDKSDPALLQVQGLLGSVFNLTVTPINSTTVLISWSPPFTLEGVPILGYNVTITNTISERYETMFIEETSLQYYYDYYYWMDYYNSEDEYYVTVAPINDVGTGPNVTSSPFAFPPPPSSVTPSVGSSQTNVTVTSQGTSPSPSAYIVVPSVGVVELSGPIVPALIVTPLVFVLVVMVVVCVVVKMVCVVVKRKNNVTPSCNGRQDRDVSLTIKFQNSSVEEPTQQQEAEQPVPFNPEPNITTTPQREQNQAQLDNLTVPERVEQSSSLISKKNLLI